MKKKILILIAVAMLAFIFQAFALVLQPLEQKVPVPTQPITPTQKVNPQQIMPKKITRPPSPKTVFITSEHYTGNIGGVSGGDAICLSLARAAGLTGMYKAWLSVGSAASSPSTRFTRSKGPYKLLDGRVVANDWNSLVSGRLLTAINITEKGTIAHDDTGKDRVWSGTAITGQYYTLGEYCSGWVSDQAPTPSADHYGSTGKYPSTGHDWTAAGPLPCNNKFRIYCFEQ